MDIISTGFSVAHGGLWGKLTGVERLTEADNYASYARGSIEEKACVEAHKFALLAYETRVTGGSGVG